MNKILKRVLIGAGIFVGVVVLGAGGYVGYVILSYNRIGDCDLKVDSKSELEKVAVGDTYKVLTYNIGFGAYSQDFDFFLDTGYDEEGKETCGHHSTAKSKDEVIFNTNGAISTTLEQNPDFVCFQEVDTDSTRSYHINQDSKIQEKYPAYDHVHAINFHSAFLPYPLYDMHGAVKGGLTTISKYKIQEAKRHEYTVSTGFSKFFDLDRCFSSSVIDVSNGRKLYICNSHMSAYDEGGVIRAKQVEELNAFLKERKDNGDYVVFAGDWNNDLLTNNPDFTYNTTDHRPFGETKKDPDWVSKFFDEEGKSPVIEGFKVVASDNYPTSRNNDIEYIPGKTYTTAIDGFIVSENIEVVSHENIQTKNGNKGLDGFAFSDHDPSLLEFKLL
ncbi:MAG: endonuclease/exonuclease/phosphatase family protein [Bacilli bacterium]|nr:endonuclease/exonuclease/phosphatase family protein [Bacilli bacterium]